VQTQCLGKVGREADAIMHSAKIDRARVTSHDVVKRFLNVRPLEVKGNLKIDKSRSIRMVNVPRTDGTLRYDRLESVPVSSVQLEC